VGSVGLKLVKELIMKVVIMKAATINNWKPKKLFSCFAFTACIGISLVSTPAAFADKSAKTSTDNKQVQNTQVQNRTVKKKRVRRAQTMRSKIFKKLDKVRELTDANDYIAAAKKLEAMGEIKRNSYEVAMTWNMHAYMHFNQENYSAAAQAYEKILIGKRVPESLVQTTLYSLAKLYLIQQDYKPALETLNKWFALVERPGAEAYVLRAQVNYQLEQYKQALPDIKQALSITLEKGKKPRENWLLMERAVYFQNKDYISMERCLKDLIAFYPSSSSIAQYWVQLSAIYNELGNVDAELATLETAYDQGLLLKESQLVSLAQAMLGKDIPYKSAQIMLQGIKAKTIEESAKNLSLLGDALMLAKEYEHAITIMKKAAELSDSAKDYYKLAQIHTERQEWDQALANVNKAMDKNDPESRFAITVHEARILKGLVLFNMKDLMLAKAEFEIASESMAAKKIADQWLKYIAGEEKRIAFIAGTE